jgi:hypothetical protein
MKLTIQLVPIPPPGLPDSTPDPPNVLHYTTGQKLDLILRSGAILPTTAKVPPHEKPVAWFSTSPQWEPTATKFPAPGKLGQLMTARAQGGLARIQVPASAAPHRIQDLPRLAGTTLEDWIGLLLAGIELGSDPDTWRFSLASVPVALFREVKFFDYPTDRWHAVDLAELACRN